MKIKTIITGCVFLAACSSQRVSKSPLLPLQNIAIATTVEDSVLKELQAKNKIVLAYSIEDYAWTRIATNYVLALNNKGWTGYNYKAPLSKSVMNSSTQYVVSSFAVERATGDSILQLTTNQEAWKIHGDNGSDFCPGSGSDSSAVTVCNITDQPTYKLLIYKEKVLLPPRIMHLLILKNVARATRTVRSFCK